MQILKNNIRENIEVSAVKLFHEENFKEVSMRDIAFESNISVGNIYRYYDNKEDLFISILKATMEKLLELFIYIDGYEINSKTDYDRLIIDILQKFLYIYNKDKIKVEIIVMNMDNELFQDDLFNIRIIMVKKIKELIKKYNSNLDEQFLANTLMDSIKVNIISIFNKYSNEEEVIKYISEIIKIYFIHFL